MRHERPSRVAAAPGPHTVKPENLFGRLWPRSPLASACGARPRSRSDSSDTSPDASIPKYK
eukprot:765646-Pyramimonas_sp.AAC.1